MPNTVTREVTTAYLRAGDLVVDAASKTVIGHTVLHTRPNRTRYQVEFAPNISKAFLPNVVFTVERSEPTLEELAQQEYDREVYMLEYQITKLHTEKHVQIMAKATEQGRDAYLRWSEIDDLIQSQEEARYFAALTDKVEMFQLNGCDKLTALKAAFGFLVSLAEDRYPRSPLSRSTATISNIQDDVAHYVEDKILHDVTRDSRQNREELLQTYRDAVEAMRAQQ
jgi:hypothetical protein